MTCNSFKTNLLSPSLSTEKDIVDGDGEYPSSWNNHGEALLVAVKIGQTSLAERGNSGYPHISVPYGRASEYSRDYSEINVILVCMQCR